MPSTASPDDSGSLTTTTSSTSTTTSSTTSTTTTTTSTTTTTTTTTSSTTTTTTTTTTTSTTTTTTTAPPVTSGSVEAFIASAGQIPAAVPNVACNGAFGWCLGTPFAKVTAALGIEDDRWGADGTISHQWDRGSWWMTIKENDIGAITRIHVSTDGSAVIALNDGTPLGATTIGELRSRVPATTCFFAAENWVFYDHVYVAGPEGTEIVVFGTDFTGETDPGGFGPVVDGSVVTSWSVSFDGPSCHPEP